MVDKSVGFQSFKVNNCKVGVKCAVVVIYYRSKGVVLCQHRNKTSPRLLNTTSRFHQVSVYYTLPVTKQVKNIHFCNAKQHLDWYWSASSPLGRLWFNCGSSSVSNVKRVRVRYHLEDKSVAEQAS